MNATDLVVGIVLLVEAMRPHAQFPPPFESAPPTWVEWATPGRPAELLARPQNESAHECCIAPSQHSRAMERIRQVWPSLPPRPIGRPLFGGGGARPLAPKGGAGLAEMRAQIDKARENLTPNSEKKPAEAEPENPTMMFWKKWMTAKDFGKDEPVECRTWGLPLTTSWQCLWKTAWWGPHGFLTGNEPRDKNEESNYKRCHCYFKWFFERDPHIRTESDTKNQKRLQKAEKPALDQLVLGKNLFEHLFMGILLGWFLAILNVQIYAGEAPWIDGIYGMWGSKATTRKDLNDLVNKEIVLANANAAGGKPGDPDTDPR